MARSYKFAILRSTPDPRRGETVNIGIAVLDADQIDVRILPNLSKLQGIDGTVDVAEIFALEKQLPAALLRTPALQERVDILADFGLVNSASIGEFVAHDHRSYERVVSDLMDQLIRPPKRTRARVRDTRIATQLKKKFQTKSLLGESLGDIDRHLVVPHYPISEQLELYADFALKNGAMNLVQTIDFRGKNAPSAEKFRQACTIAFGFVKAQEEFSETKRYVMYAADPEALPTVERHMNVLAEDADHVLNYESPGDRQFLIGAIESAASGQSALLQ